MKHSYHPILTIRSHVRAGDATCTCTCDMPHETGGVTPAKTQMTNTVPSLPTSTSKAVITA